MGIPRKVEAADPPQCFLYGNQPQIPILLDLVNAVVAIGLVERSRCPAVPIVDIHERVFHSLDGADFRVDVSVEHPREVRIV